MSCLPAGSKWLWVDNEDFSAGRTASLEGVRKGNQNKKKEW